MTRILVVRRPLNSHRAKNSRRALAPVEPDASAFRLIVTTRKPGRDEALTALFP